MNRVLRAICWCAFRVGFCLVIACSALAGPPPNVQVNQPDNNTGTNDNNTTQSETCHAVFGSTIVVGFNDTRQAVNGLPSITSLQSFAYSTDGGLTFTDGGQFAPATGSVHYGDPAVAVDSLGNFYMASLAGASPFSSSVITQVAVARSTSTTPSVTFGTPVLLNGTFSGVSANQDKELMAIDTSGGPYNDRVYIAWTNFQDSFNGTSRILFARSTSNSPLAFAPPSALNPVADETTSLLNHGAMPAVGPNGEVYVVWARFGWSPGITSSSIRLVKSTDGGVTFQNPDPGDPAPNKTVANPNVTPQNMNSGGVSIRTRDFPYIAVDRTPSGSPTRGYVYIVFQARPSGGGTDRSDIFFTRSTDGGKTWSTPRSINRGPAVTVNPDSTTNDNWQPSLSVSPSNGQLSVTFYDRRGDPANTKIALFRAVSTDYGLTWFNEQISTGSFTPSTGYDFINATYMGDYIWSAADSTSFHYSWGDCRNLCMPPPGSPNPPTPTGRPDQDVFYAKTPVLSGADLFITPWGAITGVGPLWQSPDIFVVDATNNPINAVKGQVNRLRARVSNLGNAPAMGVVVRFRYAPCFAGLTDAALKLIGTVTLDFAAAGDPLGNDLKIVPINWDLTNLADNNGGAWPSPISAFTHFCVRVDVEYAADINLSNNSAQTNFFDVPTMTGASLLVFMVGNPLEKEVQAELLAELPRGFHAELQEFPAKLGEKFLLKPREIKLAKIQFSPPEGLPKQPPPIDLVAHISFRIGANDVGGLSVRLVQAERKNERMVAKDFDTVWKAVLAVLKDKEEAVALADQKKGVINTRSIDVDNRRLRAIVDKSDQRIAEKQDGRYVLTIEVKRMQDKVKVVVTPLIIANSAADNPLGGQPMPSNGALEREHLDAIVQKAGG